MNLTWLIAAGLAAPYAVEAARKPVPEDLPRDGARTTLSQGRTFYRWHGPENTPVIVCIHGLTTPSYVWDGLIPYLVGAGFRVLSYDLYGRGLSDRPRGRQDSQFFCQQLDDLLNDQGVEGAVTLMGNSMGSAIATAFAARFPGRVRQLALLVPAGMGVDLGPVANFTRKTPIIGDWLMQVFYPSSLRKGAEMERALPSSVPGIVDRQIDELKYKGFLRSVTSSLRAMLGRSLQSEHQEVARQGIPVLAVWGETDTIIPLSCKDRLAEWNPDADHVVLSLAGHGLVYTRTNDLADQIMQKLVRTG